MRSTEGANVYVGNRLRLGKITGCLMAVIMRGCRQLRMRTRTRTKTVEDKAEDNDEDEDG